MISSDHQPNWKLPLVLSTLLAAGGTFVYWHQYSHKPKQEKADTELKKPLALPSEDTPIAMIKVKTGKGLVELKCEDLAAKKCKVSDPGKWKVTHPLELAADNDSVKEFLTAATGLLATETVDLKEETPEKRQKLLQEYGLSDQQRTDLNTQFAELITEDGKRYTAWFGNEHPLGDKFFTARAVDGKIQDETIYLISSYTKNNLAKNLTYFRDKMLFTFARGEVDSFEATTSGGKLSGKKVNGLWQINGLPGEHDRIETALASIAKTEAKDFPDASVYAGAKPVVKYRLTRKDKTDTIEVLVKDLDPTHAENKDAEDDDGHGHGKHTSPKQYFAKVSTRPEVVEIDSVLVTQIDKKPNEFRKATIFSDTEKATATVMAVSFKGGKSPLAFEFKQGAWAPKDPAIKIADKKAQTLIDALSNSRIAQYVPAVPAGGKEEMTVTVGDDKNPQKLKIRFVSVKNQVYGVDLLSGRKEAMEMTEAMKSTLPFTEDSWKIKQ
jgi:hypothetical protein